MAADPGPVEQRLGDRCGPVAQRHQPDPQASQGLDAVWDVRHAPERAANPAMMCSTAVLGLAVQREPVEVDAQCLRRDVGKRLAGIDGGQGEAVAEKSREPGLCQVSWRADVLEPLAHRRHVRERLVDVEDQEGRSPRSVRTHGVVRTGKSVVGAFARHAPHRSPGLIGSHRGSPPPADAWASGSPVPWRVLALRYPMLETRYGIV